LRVRLPAELLRYVVEKGSVAIDGVSLTVAELHDDGVSIAVIPHTLAVTTLGSVGRGDPVNVEVDLIAKYAERLIEGTDGRGPDE
jgi:riboflavin synthase